MLVLCPTEYRRGIGLFDYKVELLDGITPPPSFVYA